MFEKSVRNEKYRWEDKWDKVEEREVFRSLQPWYMDFQIEYIFEQLKKSEKWAIEVGDKRFRFIKETK